MSTCPSLSCPGLCCEGHFIFKPEQLHGTIVISWTLFINKPVSSILLHQRKCIEMKTQFCHFVAIWVITNIFTPSCLLHPFNGGKGSREDMRTRYLEVVALWMMYKHQNSLLLGSRFLLSTKCCGLDVVWVSSGNNYVLMFYHCVVWEQGRFNSPTAFRGGDSVTGLGFDKVIRARFTTDF